MNQSLNKIIWKRHFFVLILAVMVIIGSFSLSSITNTNNWKREYDYTLSDEFKQQFYSDTEWLEDYKQSSKEKDVDAYNRYKNESLNAMKVFDHANYTLFSSFGYILDFFLPLMALFLGFYVFFFDNKSSFNRMWFSSKFSRKDIYWRKLLLFFPSILLANLIGGVTFVSIIFKVIPSEFIKGSFEQIIPSILVDTLSTGVYFLLGTLAGIILGEMITASVTLFLAYVSIWAVINTLIDCYYRVLGQATGDNQHFLSSWSSNFGTQQVPWFQWATLIIVGIGVILVSRICYRKVSMEYTGNYLMISSLKRPIQLFIIIYGFIFLKLNTVLWAFTDKVNYTSSDRVSEVITSVITCLLLYMISELVIFKKLTLFRKKIRV